MAFSRYVGRFAPSPTGPLHFGSLVAAVASYLDARSHGGDWLIRIEDLDTERQRPGASDRILFDLERFGLRWDGAVVYQSQRIELYRSAFERLASAGLIYPCVCSRKEAGGGRCRRGCSRGLAPGAHTRSWRLRVPLSTSIAFEDRVYGRNVQDVAEAVGDFIVQRADGPFAYQLAVVVDDADQGITDVVRGADLLDNVPRQMLLQHLLGYRTPRYTHIPIATDAKGLKLSKSTGAAALHLDTPALELGRALAFLAHAVPGDVNSSSVEELLSWAIQVWDVDKVRGTT